MICGNTIRLKFALVDVERDGGVELVLVFICQEKIEGDGNMADSDLTDLICTASNLC